MSNTDGINSSAFGEKNNDMSGLWEQNKLFYFKYSNRYYNLYKERCRASGVELDDLIQACYIALHKAAQSYDEAAGKTLLAYSIYFIRREFAELVGYIKRLPTPLNAFTSLDEPLTDADGLTRMDALMDENSELDFEDVLDRAYNEYLAEVLWGCVNNLDARSAKIITEFYRNNKPHDDIAAQIGVSPERTRQLKYKALCKLRHTKKLQDAYETTYDRVLIDGAYRNTGIASFKSNSASSVELAYERAEETSHNMRERLIDERLKRILEQYAEIY